MFVDGELEIASFAGEEGTKHVTFRIIASTYRILGGGRGSSPELSIAHAERSHAGTA